MSDTNHTDLWTTILQVIKKDLNPRSYETWFIHTRSVSCAEGIITVEAPNGYFRDWLVDHYTEMVEEAAVRACNKKIKVKFVVGEGAVPKEEGEAKKPQASRKPRPGSQDKVLLQFRLNPRCVFNNFVVGSGNRFAHAAAMAVAKSPAKAYNPLFIYGGVGMGKTHLLQAIAHQMRQESQDAKVIYISSEKFTNQLISSIQNRSTSSFRQMYRTVDALLIDDIQFIAGKESTQEEFFHTFNVLYDAHKQIVLSSDRMPKEISSLEQRLVSRFEWGLITDIQPPDLETRIAILQKKLEIENIAVPDEVTYFIAEKIKTNIRELEGALVRVVAYSSLVGERISLALAQDILKDMLKEEKRVSVDAIQKEVAAAFDISISDLRSKKRARTIAFPRQVAMYLSRILTEYSLPQIGEYFGGRDHTTVLHAYQRVEKEGKRSKNTQKMLDGLVEKIKA